MVGKVKRGTAVETAVVVVCTREKLPTVMRRIGSRGEKGEIRNVDEKG